MRKQQTMHLKSRLPLVRLSLSLVCALALSSCAASGTNRALSSTASSPSVTDMPDRIEGYNRFMFKVNDSIDRHALEPVARGYRAVAPQPVRTAVSNFLKNLKSPNNIANQLLQGDFQGAGNDLVRFVLNTAVGVGGLFDVAGANGFKYQQEDFGQTLGVWGVGNGSYFIIPILGPSSLRDGTGLLVDSFTDPLRIYFYNTNQEGWDDARLAVTLLSAREELLDAVNDLRKHSFDYYAATRSAYTQRRASLLRDGSAGAPAGPHGRVTGGNADHP